MQFITTIFGWLNDQLLKMTWLYDLVELFVEKVFGLPVPVGKGVGSGTVLAFMMAVTAYCSRLPALSLLVF